MTLYINHHEILDDLLLRKNKFISKDPWVERICKVLLGESIIFMGSTERWLNLRKSLGAAFYKDKLIKYMEIID